MSCWLRILVKMNKYKIKKVKKGKEIKENDIN